MGGPAARWLTATATLRSAVGAAAAAEAISNSFYEYGDLSVAVDWSAPKSCRVGTSPYESLRWLASAVRSWDGLPSCVVQGKPQRPGSISEQGERRERAPAHRLDHDWRTSPGFGSPGPAGIDWVAAAPATTGAVPALGGGAFHNLDPLSLVLSGLGARWFFDLAPDQSAGPRPKNP